jgi:predicted nucleotide-binding protein
MAKAKATYRSTIFIASSGESKFIADAIKANFDREADVDIWSENIFKLNQGTLSTLMNRASYYDFFIAVFAADDTAIIKRQKRNVTRDNVIFEFGLFLGRIGLDRTFFILEEGVDIFSDWDGITKTSFRRRDNLVAAVGNACSQIRERMAVANKLDKFTVLPSTSLAFGYYHNFLKPVLQALDNQKSIEIILEKD